MKIFYLSILFSFNLFAQWQPVVPYPTLNDIIYIKAFTENEYIICTSSSGWGPSGFEIFTTDNAGKKWKSISKISGSYLHKAFFLDKMHGWAVSRWPYYKFWRTTDGGLHWNGYDLPGIAYNDVFFLNEKIGFLGASKSLMKTTDGGESWHVLYSDSIGGFFSLSVLNENFIACAGGQNIKITTDGGNNWSTYTDSTLDYGFDGIYFVDSINGYAMDNYLIWMKTTDGGKTWQRIVNWNNSAYGYADARFHNNTGIIAYGSYECCATLYITTDRGDTWNEKSVDLDPKSISFINDSTFLIAGDLGLIYMTTDFGSTFTLIGKAKTRHVNGISFTRKGYGYFNVGPALLHTSDGGETFVDIPSHAGKITAVGDSLIMGFGNNKIFRSTNKGVEWNEIIISPQPGAMWEFSMPDSETGYFTSNAGIYKTTDAGAGWFHISPLRQSGISFANKDNGFVMNEHIYKTTDGGSSWQQQAYVYYGSIAMLNNELGAGGFNEIFYTYDGGVNWTQSVIYGTHPADELWDIEVFNHNGSIIGYAYFFDTGTLYYSTDSLRTWQKDYEFPLIWLDEFDKIPHLFYDGEALWAGTEHGFILKRNNFEDLLTSINDETEIKISEYQLVQNYPNPFNPSTTIKYKVSGSSGVTSLKIYDILGNEIAVLVNEEKPAGEYQVQWDASTYSSGVYFYRLTSGEFTLTKKLLLMK